jgi:aminoglycoside phosphotransferase (APT) family kinase protein
MPRPTVIARGFSATTYDTLDGYVLRVAHDQEAHQRHLREAAILSAIQRHLSGYDLPLPIEVRPPSSRHRYGAIRCPLLQGQHPGVSVDPGTIADFLQTLHAVPLDSLRHLVGSFDTWLAGQFRTAVEGAEALSGQLDHDTELWLSRFVVDLPNQLGAGINPGLVHGDFWSENLLVRRGRLTGVLDWEAAAIGDVAVDLAGLWYLGPALPRQVAAALEWSSATVRRAQHYRVIRELHGAAWSVRHKDAQELTESAAKVIAVVRDVRGSTATS